MYKLSHKLFPIALLLLASGPFVTANAEIPWQRSPEKVLQNARETGKPILVFVSAKWCHYCTKMKRETWSHPKVQSAIGDHFETLVLDGDRDEAIVSKLGVRGFPATLVYTANGDFVQQKGGYMPPEKTLAWLGSLRR